MLFESDEESDILLHEDATRQQHTSVLFSDDEDDEDNVRHASPIPRSAEPAHITRTESSESIPEAIEINDGEAEEDNVRALTPVPRAPSPKRNSNIDTHTAAGATTPSGAKNVASSAPRVSAGVASGSPAKKKGLDSPKPVVPRPHPLVAERDAGDKAKKREAVRSIQQHELKLSALHHEVWSVVAKEAGRDYAVLEELRLSLDTALAAETSRLASVIHRISRNVRSLQASLQSMQETPTVQWMEALHNSMEAIEHGITALKEQQREQYDVLMRGEKGLTSELDQFAQRVEAWDHLDSARPAPKNMLFAPSTALAANVPPEVAVYERFVVEHGGLNGGWDEYDHGTFMRLRARFGQQPDFIARVLSALPTKEEPDVQRHEEWFSKLQQLQESKRVAISQWKDRKRAQDEAERARLEQEKAQQEAQEKQEQERERLRKIAEKEEKKASLMSWKQQQEQERQAAERQRQETEQRQREAAARAEEEKRTHIQEKLKVVQQVRAREQQEREEQARAHALAEAERRRAAQSELHVFQERDQASLAEKARKEKAALAEEAAREERLQRLRSTVKVNVARDPARLLRATESTKHRAADESRPGGRVYIAGPALAVPTWRKGL